VAFDVFFHPLAAEDLEAIDAYIAQDSPDRARAFVLRIRRQCENLTTFPYRGRSRPDLAEGVRLLSFERAVVIAYQVDLDRVTIWRVIGAGRDLDQLLSDPDIAKP
jgi:toxin ParE1/3/4